MATSKKLLLINGFWSPTSIINEFLSKSETDSNIYLTFPLGIMTIAGWCRQEFPDYNMQVIDLMMELHKFFTDSKRQKIDLDSFILNILKRISSVPDYIGVSMGSSNGHKPNLQLVLLCKKLWPDSKVIVGGMHATTFTHRLIGNPDIDYIIRGPGDIAFVELLKCLTKNQDTHHIQGVVTEIDTISSLASRLDDLNQIPRYPYDLIDMEYLLVNDATAPIIQAGARTGMVITSRGCPYSCAYCAANQIHGKKVCFSNVDKVVADIKYLIHTYNVNQICVIDDLFGADKKFFFNLFRAIDNEKLKFKIVIPAGLSLKTYNEEMIDVLIAHGLDAVYFPLESGSKYVQDYVIKKRIDLDKAIRLIMYAKNKKLFTGVNIVLGSPGETKEMMLETYEFLKRLPIDWVAFFSAYPYLGTEMTDILLKRGDINEDQLVELWDNSTQGFKRRSFDTEEITGEELADLIDDFNIQLNFFNNYNIRTRNFDQIIPKLSKIIERYPFHVVALACRTKCYYDQGHKDHAFNDIKRIFTLIGQNSFSQKMYNKYRSDIQNLIGMQIEANGVQ